MIFGGTQRASCSSVSPLTEWLVLPNPHPHPSIRLSMLPTAKNGRKGIADDGYGAVEGTALAVAVVTAAALPLLLVVVLAVVVGSE